jgi:hypothetical protein
MKSINAILCSIVMLNSCTESLPVEYVGVYRGVQEEHELVINGNSLGTIPELLYQFDIRNNGTIVVTEDSSDDIPDILEGTFEIVSISADAYTIRYEVNQGKNTGTLILKNDGSGEQITLDPPVKLLKI